MRLLQGRERRRGHRWVVKVRDIVRNVWRRETGALRYREPLSDSTSPNDGGDGRLDIYVANLGDERIYGYCTTDDPKADNPIPTTFDVSAYCVIDDDFREPIFSQHTPLENTKVTVAHEFFHAVQAAYDWKETSGCSRGRRPGSRTRCTTGSTTTRVPGEDPLSASFVPLDLGAQGFQYGSWIYFRRLSERFGSRIVRSIWNRADTSASGPDDYSVQAISRALSGRGTSFRAAFNDFSRANRRARLFYDEGAAYPARPAALRTWTLTGARRTRSGAPALYQLGAETVVFKPGRGIGRRAEPRSANLPSASRGSEAAVLRFRPSGKLIKSSRINLNGAGDKTLRVGFGRGNVGRVELVLINASTRYRCGLGCRAPARAFRATTGAPTASARGRSDNRRPKPPAGPSQTRCSWPSLQSRLYPRLAPGEGSWGHASSRSTTSSVSSLRPWANSRPSPTIRKPHFVNTRIDAALSLAARA